MQFQAVLSNQHHPESGVVTVPFPIPRAEYDNTIALLGPLEIGDAVRRDCRIDEVSGGFPVLKQLERTNVNLDELDYLAKRLDSFDDYEKTEFQGMASRLDLHGVDEFINLTFCCQEVTVVTDFNNLESLGRRHYLTLGGGASMEDMQGRDFRSVALALLDGEVGRVTPYGVVYDNGFELSQLYDGHSFPQYRYGAMTPNAVGDRLRLHMRKAEMNYDPGCHKGFHSFRRYVATQMIDGGVPIDTVKEILGHTQIDSMKPYVRISKKRLLVCALDLDGIEVTQEALL